MAAPRSSAPRKPRTPAHAVEAVPGTEAWTRLMDSVQPQLRALHRMEVAAAVAQGVTHEFNNLLMAIRGNVALLQMTESLDLTVTHRLDQIEAAAARATDLTRQFQGLVRSAEAKPALTSFAEALREAVALAGLVVRRRVTFQVQESGGPLPVLMDRAQAVQTVFALCLNAAESMPEGGTVTVATEAGAFAGGRSGVPAAPADRAHLRCRIRDAGPGLPPETQAKVFSPFFTTKPAGRGTGLGLAMARAAVEANEGWLELEAPEGGGTLVTLHLPLACSGLEP